MLARTVRRSFWSLLTTGLILLPGGIRAVAGGGGGAAASSPATPIEQLASAVPEGFQLQEVSVETGKAADGADKLVRATYLGSGIRNEIRYHVFATERGAESYLQALEPDLCEVRSLVQCSAQAGHTVVTGLSATPCPHPAPEALDRARALQRFGVSRVAR